MMATIDQMKLVKSVTMVAVLKVSYTVSYQLFSLQSLNNIRIISGLKMIIWVTGVLRGTVVGD